MTERPAIVLVDRPTAERFDAEIDGAIAGSAFYRIVDDRVVVTHTEVGDEFEGRGVASAIADAVLAKVRDDGRQIVPLCPFFAGYIERHPEYEPLVDRATYDRLTS
jgi:predicted GNAT family acetyltransferase